MFGKKDDARVFEVLGRRFELPMLKLGKRLARASALRRRLGATWSEAFFEPLLSRFHKPERRAEVAFARAYRLLASHEAVVEAALTHVLVYEHALAAAADFVDEKARKKVAALLERAHERERVASRAARLADRVESELEADLALIADRMRAIGTAAHLMLIRLDRRRGHVRGLIDKLEEREAALIDQRNLLTHDEHNWYFHEAMRRDEDLERWLVAPDRLCASIEGVLQHLVAELEGLEAKISAMPASVERVLARVDDGASAPSLESLLDLEGFERLTAVGDANAVPSRLDDTDWDDVLHHAHESELVLSATSPAALAVEIEDWLARARGRAPLPTRRCGTCEAALLGRKGPGRGHVLCPYCRERARLGGMAWLGEVGFEPTRQRGQRDSGLVTRVVFESVMGSVPSVGPARGPVTGVTWYEAIAFCNALSEREGRPPVYRTSGRTTTRRRAHAEEGWRLPESLENRDKSDHPVREWLFSAEGEEGQRALGPGPRLVASANPRQPTGRAVTETRDPDLGFRVLSPVPRPAPRPVASEAARPPARVVRPVAPQRTKKLTPKAGRRVMQVLSLTALVALAMHLTLDEFASPTSPSPASDTRTANEPLPVPPIPSFDDGEPAVRPGDKPRSHTVPGDPLSEPRANAPVTDASPEIQASLEAAEKARQKKDRRGALKAFETVLERDPGHLDARYGAAREAAALRDANKAFAHLEVLIASEKAAATKLLAEALGEPDFARLKKDARWGRVVRAVSDAP